MHRKPHLPAKTCPVCEKPFVWRKKWARDWERVIYCSERCRRQTRSARAKKRSRPAASDDQLSLF